jgi:hypothetical protein
MRVKGFILSTDAILAVAIAVVLAGAVVTLTLNSPVDTYAGKIALARDYLVLRYDDYQPISAETSPLLESLNLNDSQPISNLTYWTAEIYAPPGLFGCPSTNCSFTDYTPNVSLFFAQGEFNTSAYYNASYYHRAWVNG